MIYRKLRVAVILQSALLALWIGLFFFVIFKHRLTAAIVILAGIIVYQVWSLIHTVDKTNRDLIRFFQSVHFGDFTQTFAAKDRDKSFAGLHAALTEVMEAFRRARAEKEEQALYLQAVVQHIGVGLIVFQSTGDVDLINNAAKRLLKLVRLKNIHDLEANHAELVGALLRMKPGERALVKPLIGGEPLQLSLYATELRLRGKDFRLVSIQDIRSELEEKEIEAWQGIIRVLTHEIMNSMTPISSLASTVQGLIGPGATSLDDPDTRTDVQRALQTIQKRSEGLLHFVDSYRNLARIKKPNLQLFPVQNLFRSVEQLLRPKLSEAEIDMTSSAKPPDLELLGDPDLLEQVLINLLLNAVDALYAVDNPKIEISASLDERGRPVIQVKDNGVGIAPDVLDKVFVPFFSTKEGGAGIGLSLSRQIMRLHNGSIALASQPGETVFTLRFKL